MQSLVSFYRSFLTFCSLCLQPIWTTSMRVRIVSCYPLEKSSTVSLFCSAEHKVVVAHVQRGMKPTGMFEERVLVCVCVCILTSVMSLLSL